MEGFEELVKRHEAIATLTDIADVAREATHPTIADSLRTYHDELRDFYNKAVLRAENENAQKYQRERAVESDKLVVPSLRWRLLARWSLPRWSLPRWR